LNPVMYNMIDSAFFIYVHLFIAGIIILEAMSHDIPRKELILGTP
jgi:hypothetical protein